MMTIPQFTATPSRISVSKDRQSLEIAWNNGAISQLSSIYLRENCRSADATRAKLYGSQQPCTEDLTIHEVQPVGHYAINISFSDGHDRGIYPWEYLHNLATTNAGDN